MFIDKLIEGHNWRFQSLRSSPKSRFSWEKMYDLMGFKCPSSFFSSLSDYVHGLSTSNLNLNYVFVNRFISIIYNLNGRKVMTWILKDT